MCTSLAQRLADAREVEQAVLGVVKRFPGMCLVCVGRKTGYRDDRLREAKRSLMEQGLIREDPNQPHFPEEMRPLIPIGR